MKRIFLLLALAVVAAAACGTIAMAAGGDDATPADPTAAPPLQDSWTNTVKSEHPIGFEVAPPASTDGVIEPSVALDKAWSQEAAPSKPESATVVLTELTWPEFDIKAATVWVVSYPEVCQPLFGGMTQEGEVDEDRPDCMNATFNTVVDAITGDYLISFSDGTEVFDSKTR